MPDQSGALLAAVLEIRELIQLMAQPAIAQRDVGLRVALRKIVGKSAVMQKAVLLMDGSRSQLDIRTQLKADAGNLSRLVKALRAGNLLNGDEKPKLTVVLPPRFFESTEGQ